MSTIQPPQKQPKDLGLRTTEFAQRVRWWARKIPRTVSSIEDLSQLIRASGSVGANYIEANESLGRKDQGMRLKICRKEAKESAYWLQLLDISLPPDLERERLAMMKEAHELKAIFHTIIQKHYN